MSTCKELLHLLVNKIKFFKNDIDLKIKFGKVLMKLTTEIEK